MSSLLSEEKLEQLLEFASLAPQNGVFIEVGVYKGGALKVLADAFPERGMMGFDTFTGLPEKYDGDDEVHPVGDFSDTSYEEVEKLFRPEQVELVRGIFPDSCTRLPNVAFAHLDMDYWRGTLKALEFIWPCLVPGGVLVFDDYDWVRCPGIAPLVQTWAAAHKSSSLFVKDYQACIIKGAV